LERFGFRFAHDADACYFEQFFRQAARYSCPVPRISRALPTPATQAHARLAGGNGSPQSESQADVLERIQKRLESIEQQLAVQLKRTGDLQVQLDRAIAERPIPPKV
jgi:hypothetical protein